MSPNDAAELNRVFIAGLQAISLLLLIGFVIFVIGLSRSAGQRDRTRRMWAREAAVRQVAAFSAPVLDAAGGRPGIRAIETIMALLRAEGVKLTEPQTSGRGWELRAQYENRIFLISVGAPLVVTVVQQGGSEEDAFNRRSPLARFMEVFHAALSKDERLQGLAWSRLKGAPAWPAAAHPLADFERLSVPKAEVVQPPAASARPISAPSPVRPAAPRDQSSPRRPSPGAGAGPRPFAMVVSDYPDDTVWDENDDVARPGCHNICEAIIAAMAPLGWQADYFDQRNDFQWELVLKRDGERFHFVTHDLGDPDRRGFSVHSDGSKPFAKTAKDAALNVFLGSLHDSLMADPRIHSLIWSYDHDPDEDETYDYPVDR